MSNIEEGLITIKQTGSKADDARADFTLDREKKEVVIAMFTLRGKPFVSSRARETFALHVLPEHGVIAFNNDSPKSHYRLDHVRRCRHAAVCRLDR